MLERFKVPQKDQVRVPHDSLQDTVASIFEKVGLSPEHAAEGADVLVTADLRGVESHGVSNVISGYIKEFGSGEMNPKPNWQIVREAPGTATIDADGGLGITLGRDAMNIAIEKARKVGVGVVTMSNSGHLGAIGHFAMLAAEQDMVGICMSAGGTDIPPTFGSEFLLGTNPISFAAPGRNEAPLLFDVATSTVAENKIKLASRVGADLEPGWISAGDGVPIMERAPVPESGRIAVLPMGGTREQGSHKGYGFMLMVEVMTSLLSGTVPNMLDKTPMESKLKNYFAAYDIAAFTDLDTFKDNMDLMLKTLKNSETTPGHERVIYPGLTEHEDEQERRTNGIPLHSDVVRWFDDITDEFSIPRLKRM